MELPGGRIIQSLIVIALDLEIANYLPRYFIGTHSSTPRPRKHLACTLPSLLHRVTYLGEVHDVLLRAPTTPSMEYLGVQGGCVQRISG